MPQSVPSPKNEQEISIQRLAAKAGVPGSGDKGHPKGKLLIDYTNGDLYINKGTASSPTWTLVGPPAA
jgi:hypothetical protein